MNFRQLKVAIVYDRVNKWGGAERVLLSLLKLFPHAHLVTSVFDESGAPWAQRFKAVKTSFLQNLKYARKNHEIFALIMPLAFESMDLSTYDLVISVTSEYAKGVITGPNTIHVCYCLTPTRYLWSSEKSYFSSYFLSKVSWPLRIYLKRWDKMAAKRPDKMISISSVVKSRISKYYERKSDLVFPPVQLIKQFPRQTNKKDYYLVVSRLVKYKRVDLVVKAFNKNKKRLLIVGTGRERSKLEKLANNNIKFLGFVDDKSLKIFYSEAKALIFPQKEDFGLVAVEAQGFGTPVIAYSKGGSKDTVISGTTGIFFHKQNVSSLNKALEIFEKTAFIQENIRKNALRFSEERFLEDFAKIIDKQ